MIENEKRSNKKRFGLIGKNISYSFSCGYFKEKFEGLQLKNHEYQNFDIERIEEFLKIKEANKNELYGLNVTIPYKEVIFPFLDKIDKTAAKIGAVNTIKITKNGSRSILHGSVRKILHRNLTVRIAPRIWNSYFIF